MADLSKAEEQFKEMVKPQKEQEIPSFEERVKAFEKDLESLRIKYKLKTNIVPTFPVYNILPDELKLVKLLLVKHNAIFKLVYADELGKDNK